MADSKIDVTQGSGVSVDTRTNDDGHHRQVVVLGHETAINSVASVQATDPSSSARGLVVRDPNSTTIVSGLRDVRVQSIVDGTVTVGDVTRVKNVVDGTLTNVYRVHNLVDGTVSVVQRVQNIIDGTLSTIQRVQNVVDGTLTAITGVDRVRNVVDGTLSLVTRVDRVHNVIDGTLSVVTTVGRVNNVVDGTLSLVNVQHTASVAAAGGVVAGSTSGVSVSGVSIVGPESGRNTKVYAISITTTAQVHNQVRFTNGAGTSPTVFWQAGLQAPSQGISGFNLAVTPPGYLFSTGSNVTLALVKDTASLVHYSVAYFKESA